MMRAEENHVQEMFLILVGSWILGAVSGPQSSNNRGGNFVVAFLEAPVFAGILAFAFALARVDMSSWKPRNARLFLVFVAVAGFSIGYLTHTNFDIVP